MDTRILNNTQTFKPTSVGLNVCVIKVGGAVVEDAEQLAILLDEFGKIEGPKVLVHGGGRSATKLAAQLGIESQMVGGRRITDAEMLEVVTMVYGGLVNKNIVAQLQARGINALGLTGADLNLIRAHRRPITPEGIDFGFVGDVDSADGAQLLHLLQMGITPVIAPLTHDGQGHMLNINADTMAQTVAVALVDKKTADSPDSPPALPVREGAITFEDGDTLPSKHSAPSLTGRAGGESGAGGESVEFGSASSLTFCFSLPGVLRDPDDPLTLIPHITETSFKELVADGTISDGMIPKLENAFAALRAGVTSVRITDIHDLQGGTVITSERVKSEK